MRGPVFTLFLFSVLFAVSEVRGTDTVKLCGLDYVRTVVYICATARWRRQAEGTLPGLQAERRSDLHREASQEILARNLAKLDFSGEELVQEEQVPTEGLRETKKHLAMSRRDLQTLCCTEGCSMTELSGLC
ncbi:Insulin-like peptide INSL5 [Heterocephalus glaber]|uniref:Insulin-like peptide INSL5 n=1 Tax=Heterocephalus glaber TaxID=10181 RepID=G5BSP6_HETGA|nr:insulin-like peptide INSL5 [Heterocephalus glaber]EHB12307.1 Insulin-like peptide INSL5 [Heterocephalus glaber]